MDLVYGFVSNGISGFLTAPIDAIKTNYQLTNKNTHLIIKNIYDARGIKGFYAGMVPSISTYPFFWSIYFGSSQYFADKTLNNNKVVDKMIKAYISASLGSFVTNPLFVIKTRLQNNDGINKGILKVISETNNIGFRAYYKGLGPTFANNTKLAIQFPMYDYLKEHTDNIALSSFTSKILSSSIFYPFDLIRVNQRVINTNQNMFSVGKSIYTKSGMRGLYRGIMLYHMTTTPNFVIMMWIFEYLKASDIKY